MSPYGNFLRNGSRNSNTKVFVILTLMKSIRLEGHWEIDAPIEKVFEFITDFENFPQMFPKVAKEVKIIHRGGDRLKVEAQVASFGRTFKVDMDVILKPGTGYISDNVSEFGTSGREDITLVDIGRKTRFDYVYDVTIRTWWLRIIAKPLIGWFAMWAWERAVIRRLQEILKEEQTVV